MPNELLLTTEAMKALRRFGLHGEATHLAHVEMICQHQLAKASAYYEEKIAELEGALKVKLMEASNADIKKLIAQARADERAKTLGEVEKWR